ncbi:hypothetical protein PoB_002877900 [Plakobranchus ocellatus]|uniref:Uncharacterized protein n=1 Tax=Plakobranchus ocellatus TaxID=259542 RepID=A0AAV4A6V3_9GAST|nr:hypothetical protein PoB_002877900 [Plakobranchus ocellatus]
MSPRKWIVLTLILLVLATALQIAGLLAPCWIYLKTTDFRVGVGLYFRVGCESSSGNNCTHPAFPASLAFGYNSDVAVALLDGDVVVVDVVTAGVCLFVFTEANLSNRFSTFLSLR